MSSFPALIFLLNKHLMQKMAHLTIKTLALLPSFGQGRLFAAVRRKYGLGKSSPILLCGTVLRDVPLFLFSPVLTCLMLQVLPRYFALLSYVEIMHSSEKGILPYASVAKD